MMNSKLQLERTAARLPPQQRDLVMALAAAVERSPWEECGVLTRTISGADALIRVYVRTAGVVDDALQCTATRARRTTRWRMASALLEELARAQECAACHGDGRGAAGFMCGDCMGSGRKPWAPSRRADACEAHHNDFRDRLAPVYALALRELADVLRAAAETTARAA